MSRPSETAQPLCAHTAVDQTFVQETFVQQTFVQSAENCVSIPARVLLVMLRFYQTYLSSMNISACKYYPSCSHYAGEAVQRFGARRGVWLAAKRLLRCQPFSRGGFDPVPDRVNDQPISSRGTTLQGDTASAVSFGQLNSGVLTPEASLHSSKNPATRGQELAQ